MSAWEPSLKMPYPGLRPFEGADAPIFFGRAAQISGMLRQLEDHRFVAVVGASGSGKSSLVRAGLLPALHEGFLLGTTDWVTLIVKPGTHPYRNLSRALVGGIDFGPDALSAATDAETRTLATLRRTDRGLTEAIRELGMPSEKNVLLLVDQFEELFAFRRASLGSGAASRDEAAAFVTMLLRSVAKPDGQLWIVLTMRSDFIGDCEAFLGLPELVSQSQFLVPRLDRGQMEEAITRPGMVRDAPFQPFGFEAGLVNRIINDAGDRPDQLPLMQHSLMRTWKIGVEEAGAGPATLTHQHYDAAGGIEHALSRDANRAWDEIKDDPDKARIARRLFLLLCDVTPDGQITRRRPSVLEVQAATGATLEQVAAVMRPFQDDDRNFLLPPVGQGLNPDTRLDVSHEALLRQWVLFATDWQEQERADAAELRRLTDLAALHQQRQGDLLRGQDLERVLRWKQRVSVEWSARYLTPERWDTAMHFIDASEREHIAAKAAAARERARALRRARWAAVAMSGVALSLLALMMANLYFYTWDYVEYYNDLVKVYGQPKGIGRLTMDQVHHRPVSFRIVRKGRRGQVQSLESIDRHEQPSRHHFVGTYVATSSGDNKETRWSYFYGSDAHVAYEMAYDHHGKPLWTLIYAPGTDAEGSRLAQFIGPDGVPRQMPGYGKGFVKIKYSPAGYEELITYRNAAGQPRSGLDKAFGRRQTFDGEGRVTNIVSIDPAGHPMNDEAGNAEFRMTYDAMGNLLTGIAADASGAVTLLKEGYAKVVTRYDSNGNASELAYYDEHDRPTLSKDGFHRWTRQVDDHGREFERRYWDLEKKPLIAAEGCHGSRSAYDDRDNLVSVVCLGLAGTPAPDADGVTTRNYKYDSDDEVIEVVYRDAGGSAVRSGEGFHRLTVHYDPHGNAIEYAYFGTDGRPIATKDGYARTASEYDAHDHEISKTYFGTDGKPKQLAEEEDKSKKQLTYAGWEKRYDGNGNVVSLSYFDADRRPVLLPAGYQSFKSTYDESGNLTEAAYFGPTGEHVRSRDGYAGWRVEYDELGRETRSEYFDVTGALVAPGGVAGWTTKFDGQGNAIERRNYGLNRQLAPGLDRAAGWRARYDARGNQIEIEYFDTRDRPTATKGGYARERRKYDARNRLLEYDVLGPNGQPVMLQAGWSRVVNRYGPIGNEAEEKHYYGTNGEPVLTRDGYHAIRNRFDQYGRTIEFTYYDRNDAPVNAQPAGQGFAYATLKQKYDPYGRLSEQQMFGADGSPRADSNGVHRLVRNFDERGQMLDELWFSVDNKPVPRAR